MVGEFRIGKKGIVEMNGNKEIENRKVRRVRQA